MSHRTGTAPPGDGEGADQVTDASRRADAAPSRRVDDAGPAVHLHLHRGVGWGLYGVGTVLVLALVLAGIWFNLGEGRYLSALAITVVGLATAAFLGVVTHAMVTPGLTVTPAGVRGRMPHGSRIDVGWPAVTIDRDDDPRPGELRLNVGDESATLSGRQWVGFREFVVLLGRSADAAARLTPAARQEAVRLLALAGHRPGALDDRPVTDVDEG